MLPSFRVDLSAHGIDPFVIRLWHIALAAAILFVGPIVGEYAAVQPWGFMGVLDLSLIPATPILLGIPLSLLAIVISPRHRRSAVIWLVLCIMGMAILFPVGLLSRRIRHRAFEQLAVRSVPLINAIPAYNLKYGRPPQKLADLVPEFLASEPRTGLGAYPNFELVSGEKARADWDGNPWALYVDCGPVVLNFDRFIYLPLQNYPKHVYGGSLERIGSWAYVHE